MPATRKPTKAPARGERLLRVPEAADRLGVHRDTVYEMFRDGRLTATNIAAPGDRPIRRVRESELDAFIEARTVPAPTRDLPGRAA